MIFLLRIIYSIRRQISYRIVKDVYNKGQINTSKWIIGKLKALDPSPELLSEWYSQNNISYKDDGFTLPKKYYNFFLDGGGSNEDYTEFAMHVLSPRYKCNTVIVSVGKSRWPVLLVCRMNEVGYWVLDQDTCTHSKSCNVGDALNMYDGYKVL